MGQGKTTTSNALSWKENNLQVNALATTWIFKWDDLWKEQDLEIQSLKHKVELGQGVPHGYFAQQNRLFFQNRLVIPRVLVGF